MLSLYVYNSDADKGKLFSSKCSLCIQKSGMKIETGKSCSEPESFEQTVQSLHDSAVYMLKKDDSFVRISKCINDSEQSSYTVFLLEKPEDIYDVVTPELRPSGLLPESFDEERTGRVISDIYADYLRVTEKAGGPSYFFKIKGTGYREYFPNIYMIEVQNKRITFRTAAQDYEFYDSLDSVLREVPDYFVRIHRSIVVNLNYIEDIDFQEKKILFYDGQERYFSRNFAAELRNSYFRGHREGSI